MESKIEEIFSAITEHYDSPLRLGSRCESNYYYRVEDLRYDDLVACSEYLRERVLNAGDIDSPRYLISLPGSYTGLAEILCKIFVDEGSTCEVLDFREIEKDEDLRAQLRSSTVVLINDVITTARSCLEAHSAVTMAGATVNSWVCLIDRTFGPGPVPVVAAHTGAPVTLLRDFS